jgi:hypothetical protein
MVWCRSGLRGDFLSFYTDLFTIHKQLHTTETRMHYTMIAYKSNGRLNEISTIAKKHNLPESFINIKKAGFSGFSERETGVEPATLSLGN